MTEPNTETTTHVYGDGCTNPAWHRDADTLWYAARGLAEDGLSVALVDYDLAPVTPRERLLIRLAITFAAEASRAVVQEAGWLRDEPTGDLQGSQIQQWADQARETLAPWDQEPMKGIG